MWKIMNTFRNSRSFSDILKKLELSSLELQEKDSKTIRKSQSLFSQQTETEHNNKDTRSKSDIRNYFKTFKNKTTNSLPSKVSQCEDICQKQNETLPSTTTNKIAAKQEVKKLFEELSETGEDLSCDIEEKLSNAESEPYESDLKVETPTPGQSTETSNTDLHQIDGNFFEITPFQSAGFCLQQPTNFDENFDAPKHGNIFETALTVSSRDSIQDFNQFQNEMNKRNEKIFADHLNTKQKISDEKINDDDGETGSNSSLCEVVSSTLIYDDQFLTQQAYLENISQSSNDSDRSNLKMKIAKKRKCLVKQRCFPYNKRSIYSETTSLPNQTVKNQKNFCIKNKIDDKYRVCDVGNSGDKVKVDDESKKEDKVKTDEQIDDKEKVEDIRKKDSYVSTRYQYPGIFVKVPVPQLAAHDKEETKSIDLITKDSSKSDESSVCLDKKYFADLKEMLMNLTPAYIERRRLEDCNSEDEEEDYKTAQGTPLSSQFYKEVVSNPQNYLIFSSNTRKSLKR